MNQQERKELLGWTWKQGRILTCNGQATTFYTRERGFPFETDELPHHHLLGNNTDVLFADWARQDVKVKNPICGVYSRPIFVGGFEHSTDHDELVYNVQTHSLFIDLRIPRLGMTLFENVKDLESMCNEDIKLYARRHVFAGYTRLEQGDDDDERPICTRHHCMDWNFVGVPRPRPNKWYVEMSPCGNIWKELAYAKDNFHQHYYWERWERLNRDGNGKGLVLALRRDRTGDNKERDGVIVVVGDHFNYMYGRMLMGNELTYGQSSLVDLVDAAIDAGDRATAESYLSIDAGHGRISMGWKIDCAIQPWKKDTRLFNVASIDIHGSDVESCRIIMDGVPYKVYESSVGIKDLETLFHSTDHDPPSIDVVESILFGSKKTKKRNYETALSLDKE